MQCYITLLKTLSACRESMRDELLFIGIGGHRLKSSDIGNVPEHWHVVSIASVCSEPIRDFGSFSSTKLITFLNKGVAFLKSEMIGDFDLNTADLTFIAEHVHATLRKSRVYPGNILFSKIGSVLGKAVVYDGRFGVCNSNAAIAKISVNETQIHPLFLCHLLNAPRIKRRMKQRIISLLPRLNLGDISSFRIPLPPISEQLTIVERIEGIRTTANQVAEAYERSKAMASELMNAWS
jgi:type I restriction enzyme S subunit